MMLKIARLKLLLLAVFCLVLIAMPVSAANTTIIVTGKGVDRAAALHDAMRNAIEQKIGVLLDSQTIVQNYQTISDTIYSHSEGYVSDYTVLHESDEQGLYTLTAQITVSEALDAVMMDRFQKVKAVETGLQDPRIGIVIIDRYDNEYSVAKNSIINVLQNNGFSRIVDLEQIKLAQKSQLATAIFQNQTDLIQTFRTKFPVDYMIVGNIDLLSAQPAASKGFHRFMSGQASIGLRMYNMNTGEIIYTDTVSGSALHTNSEMAISNALKQAASKAGPVMIQSLLKKATDPLNHLQLVVTSARLGTAKQAEQRLRNIAGVSQVYLRSSSLGTMIFDLNYYGTAFSFANTLESIGINAQEISTEFVKI